MSLGVCLMAVCVLLHGEITGKYDFSVNVSNYGRVI